MRQRNARHSCLRWLLYAGCFLLIAGCLRQPGATPPSGAPENAPGLYENAAERAAIGFRFQNGATGEHYFLETTGSGCAFFDYDRDGFPDVLMLQAGALPWDRSSSPEPRSRLYHNLGKGSFSDVTSGSGLVDVGYTQGVAVGDVNADGFDDLFITGYGGSRLYLNRRGSGKFQDVTVRSGLAPAAGGPRWETSAAFGDYNNDGRLDLYVCRYVRWSRQAHRPCKNPAGRTSYCSPELFPGDEHALYRNNGDGTFTDMSRSAGIAGHPARGLGVAWLDFDRDGWEDIFVANDLNPYFLWRNNGNGTFTDVGVRAGIAYSDLGQLLSGMGVGVRDYNGDGREDIFVTNFSGQMNALYRNEGSGFFTNVTMPSGVGAASLNLLAFGCEFLDHNRDGLPDLLVGNGHIYEDVEAYSQGVAYAQPKSLLQNNGNGTFTDLREGIGALATPRVTRGLAVADYDRDGHLDAVTNNQDGPAELLRYTGPTTGHWLAVETRGTKSNPNGYHALVTARAGGKTHTAEVRSGSSYCSHSESRVYFGLGEVAQVDELKIVWHGTRAVTTARGLAVDRAYRAVEGSGISPVTPAAGQARR